MSNITPKNSAPDFFGNTTYVGDRIRIDNMICTLVEINEDHLLFTMDGDDTLYVREYNESFIKAEKVLTPSELEEVLRSHVRQIGHVDNYEYLPGRVSNAIVTAWRKGYETAISEGYENGKAETIAAQRRAFEYVFKDYYEFLEREIFTERHVYKDELEKKWQGFIKRDKL